MLWMGIDGGGSNLRVVVVDSTLATLTESRRGTVNPSSIGHEAAKYLIQDAIREALTQIHEPVQAAGIGVAGAAAMHSSNWLRDIVREVMPDVVIAASSDFEIALMGATGECQGILLLAGTGSVAYGINDQGEALQVGGRGYLLGDEGSGYWIGMEALRLVINLFDGIRRGNSSLSSCILSRLSLQSPVEIIPWLYQTPAPRIQEIARLAPVVMDEADSGDEQAQRIIEQAAQHLKALVTTAAEQLHFPLPPSINTIAFAGGLLEVRTPLSDRVCQLLNLPTYPTPRYSPAVGAALLAKQVFEKNVDLT